MAHKADVYRAEGYQQALIDIVNAYSIGGEGNAFEWIANNAQRSDIRDHAAKAAREANARTRVTRTF